MPFWRTYYHLVWATKKRAALIDAEVEPFLYQYLFSKARELEVRVYAANGWTDHVHMVVSIPPRLAVADVVRRLKGASAHYLNHDLEMADHFQWQRGYGVLTLGERQRPVAVEYVERQKEHHGHQTTNGWLERINEFDEGPPEQELVAAQIVTGRRRVKERPVGYMVLPEDDGSPF